MKNYYINPLSIWLSIQYSRYICRTNYTQMNYLETERLILRPFAEQDTESLFIILSDVEVNAFLPMFPLKDIEEAKTYLHEKHTAINSGKTLFYYAICLKGNNIPIGYIHVSGGDSYDLGY